MTDGAQCRPNLREIDKYRAIKEIKASETKEIKASETNETKASETK